jgi:hypothetical protein
LTGFEFRVNEVRQRLHQLAKEGGAEARLNIDKDSNGSHWKKIHSVSDYVEAQVKKLDEVLARHRALAYTLLRITATIMFTSDLCPSH